MDENIIIEISKAETFYIRHPKSSYAIFCFNNHGDLFVNSDYGSYCYAWRSFGEDFKEFLKSLNVDYVIGKFELNYRQTSNKKIPKYWKEHLKVLVDTFIEKLKSN